MVRSELSRSLSCKTKSQKGYTSIRQMGGEDHTNGDYIQEAPEIVKLANPIYRICAKLSPYGSMGG